MLALSVATNPILLNVQKAYPVNVSSTNIISWSGQLQPTIVEDEALTELMLPRKLQRGESASGRRGPCDDGKGRLVEALSFEKDFAPFSLQREVFVPEARCRTPNRGRRDPCWAGRRARPAPPRGP